MVNFELAGYGRYSTPTLYGTMFSYRVPSQALLLSATTGGHPTVINPSGSGHVFIPIALSLGYISGTLVVGSVLIAETLNAGGGAATGAAIPTATLATVQPTRRGAGQQSVMQWSPTTNTFTAAPTVIGGAGISYTTTAMELAVSQVYFDGLLAFEPGSAMSITYSVTTTTAVFFTTLYGVEVPYPQL